MNVTRNKVGKDCIMYLCGYIEELALQLRVDRHVYVMPC
jgi:hypothetical protein